MIKVLPSDTLGQVQRAIADIYALPDDRLYSVSDLLSNVERFSMRALKGIRKGDEKKLKYNLTISLSWFLAVMNRFHIDTEAGIWQRFPHLCSYCGKSPCICKKNHPSRRVRIARVYSKKPGTLAGLQEMFNQIYPPGQRTLQQAGIHLAEEMGELSEAVHMYLGGHKERYFKTVIEEAADYFSCAVGVANSAGVDIAKEFARLYKNNCHVCHKAPCACSFSSVAEFKS